MMAREVAEAEAPALSIPADFDIPPELMSYFIDDNDAVSPAVAQSGDMNVSGEGSNAQLPPLEAPPSIENSSSTTMSKFLKGKEREWEAVSQRKGPLTLLELPIDVLRLIVKEITHTNDLTSLALANSTLYNLAIPHIYARFDIVWPDASSTSSDGKSVDALTYGLTTLCLGSNFAHTTHRLRCHGLRGGPMGTNSRPPKFGGVDYAKFTRKFSLGNGPPDWVAEYMINKESGKMLGTLVALAVAKMVNLETFVWDMPTGVISDIFMALASLPDHHPDNECKLDHLWVRWHDNNDITASSASSTSPITPPQQQAVVPLGSTLTPIGIMLPSSASHPKPRARIPYSDSRVEYPTFSVVPPLRGLTVLDVDEIAYLDEMSVLIEQSKNRLQELRVGVSARATHKDFAQTWDGSDLQQVDHLARWPGESTIGDRRLGGVLGILVGRIYDIRRRVGSRPKEKPPTSAAISGQTLGPPAGQGVSEDVVAGQSQEYLVPDVTPAAPVASTSNSQTPATAPPGPTSPPRVFVEVNGLKASRTPSKTTQDKGESGGRKRLEGKLKLHTLELERIPLSMQVCSKAIDWAALTNLTILECAQHENLWKLLKRQFQPSPMSAGFGISATSSRQMSNPSLQYHLNLKKIHTDVTSPALISFVKETLAPNSLEVLFLQDRRRGSGPPPVAIDVIFKGALKRHRSSLRKLLLDSSLKHNQSGGPTPDSTRWRHWALTTEILEYITSGRMNNLRELAVSLHYKDWHTFLRRLPNIPQLRSLNLPYIADHAVGTFEPKELALQIADIITLRPEIHLCYVGISTKCFEMLDVLDKDDANLANGGGLDGLGGSLGGGLGGGLGGNHSDDGSVVEVVEDASDGEETTDDEDDDDDGTETDEEDTPTSHTDPDETQSENSDGDSDADSFVDPDQGSKWHLKLREILFYDDKVAIFKARHGRL